MSDINMKIIESIESGGNPNAINKKSGAMGLFQIMPNGALAEWNNFNPKEQYSDRDLFNPEVSTKIASWYMNKRIPSMLKTYKIPDTIDNRLIAYNFGIGNLKSGKPLPSETINYLKKYKGIK